MGSNLVLTAITMSVLGMAMNCQAQEPIPTTDLSKLNFPEKHPFVFYSAAEIDMIKQLIQDESTYQYDAYMTLWKVQADGWVDKEIEIEERGSEGLEYTGRSCPTDSTTLAQEKAEDGTWQYRCSKCDAVYQGEPYDAYWRGYRNQQIALALKPLGIAYAISGDERYAQKAREILLGFAGCYQAVVNRGGCIVSYDLRENYAFITPLLHGYDLIYESPSLSAADKKKIEDDLLRVIAERRLKWGGMHNRAAWAQAMAGIIGFCIKDEKIIDQALNGRSHGYNVLMAKCVGPDGIWKEGLSYHSYTLGGLIYLSEAAYRCGINLYEDPLYRAMYEAPLGLAFPGKRPNLKLYQQYYLRTRDPKIASVLIPGVVYDRGTPLWVTPIWPKEEEAAALPSKNYGWCGYAVLRSGKGKDQKLLSITHSTDSMFMGHAPAIKFGMILFAHGQALTLYGDRAGYSHPLCLDWYRKPIAHNTLVVDEMGQDLSSGKVTLFEPGSWAKVMRATDTGAYPGVTLDRTLVLTDQYVVDISHASSESAHRYDMPYRIVGDFSLHLPGREIQGPLGWAGGYQHISQVKTHRTDGNWDATWNIQQEQEKDEIAKGLELTMLGQSGTEVISAQGPGESAAKTAPVVMARRWGKATTFMSILEPYQDKPSISQVEELSAAIDGAPVLNTQAAGIKVTSGENTDCFMVSYTSGQTCYNEQFLLDGQAGMVSLSSEAPQYLHLLDGVKLQVGAKSLDSDQPASFWAQEAEDGELLIGTGTRQGGEISVLGNFGEEVKVSKDGKELPNKVATGKQVSFSTEPNTIYKISGVESWSSVGMEVKISLPPELQRPVAETGLEGVTRFPSGVVRDVYRFPDEIQPLSGKNLVANSSFEIAEQDYQITDNWDFQNSLYFDKWRSSYVYTMATSNSGSYSLCLPRIHLFQPLGKEGSAAQIVPLPTEGERTFTLSVYAKSGPAVFTAESARPTLIRLALLGYDPNSGWDAQGGVSELLEIGAQWKRISITRTLPDQIRWVKVALRRENQAYGGHVYFDDVQLEQGSHATSFAPDSWTEKAKGGPRAILGPNLIGNAGFEEDAKGWGGISDRMPVTIDPTVAHDGGKSLRIQTDQSGSFSVASSKVELVAGARYLLSGWLKMEEITSGSGGAIIRLSGGERHFDGQYHQGTQDWTRIERIFTASKSCQVSVGLGFRNTTGTAWFDDISLRMIK